MQHTSGNAQTFERPRHSAELSATNGPPSQDSMDAALSPRVETPARRWGSRAAAQSGLQRVHGCPSVPRRGEQPGRAPVLPRQHAGAASASRDDAHWASLPQVTAGAQSYTLSLSLLVAAVTINSHPLLCVFAQCLARSGATKARASLWTCWLSATTSWRAARAARTLGTQSTTLRERSTPCTWCPAAS